MILKRHISAMMIGLTVLVATGCGPILSTSRISDAKDALENADKYDAKEKAPYEYTMAQEYLRKADELWGYSLFGDSAEYAKRSVEMAEAAAAKAQNNPWVSPLAGVTSDSN